MIDQAFIDNNIASWFESVGMTAEKYGPLVRICDVEVISIRRERLWDITDQDVRREGLTKDDADFEEWTEPDMWPTRLAWVSWFCEAMDCMPDDWVTRIEWRYKP